jgi:aminopeptidase
MSSAIAAAHTPFTLLPFDSKLDRLAEVAVRVGAGLQPDQELVITAPLDAVPLVRRITEQAYKAGAKLVTTFYADDAATLARYQHAPNKSFDYAPTWYYDALAAAYQSNAARMGITGADPALLAQQDPSKVSRANMSMSRAYKPAMELITRHAINWTIVAAATPAWASLVFPDDSPELALANLWEAIFFTSRITGDDPIADWKQHNANLLQRVHFLNDKRYHSIRFFTPDNATDLTVGLADQHLWAGGGTTAGNGFYCNANIPTEECFTTPHKARVNGHVAASKPLSRTKVRSSKTSAAPSRTARSSTPPRPPAKPPLTSSSPPTKEHASSAKLPSSRTILPSPNPASSSGTPSSTKMPPAISPSARLIPPASSAATKCLKKTSPPSAPTTASFMLTG